MRNLRIVNLTKMLLIFMTVCLSVGCLRENRSRCSDGLLLKFNYITSNGLYLESGFPEIDHLSVFVFDGNGLFISEEKDSGTPINNNYTLLLPLYEGSFQFVVWAGLSDNYETSSCITGQTRIEDFTLQLKRGADNQVNTPPPLLYFGQHETITLSPTHTEQITIGLQRITNTIQVIVHTANTTVPPQISIQDNNGTYNHQGEIMPDQSFHYFPYDIHTLDNPGTWVADFNIMLLQNDSNAMLQITNPDGELQYNEKLVSGLLAANPNINFNTDHEFTIEITFDEFYVPVSILVNDWEIISEEIN